MSEKMEPVLSVEEWAARKADPVIEFPRYGSAETAPHWIAVLNDALPASDRRKITRETIAKLRELQGDQLDAFTYDLAEALETYLAPP